MASRFIYSPSARQIFFRNDLKSLDDCIEMPDAYHAALLVGQGSGKLWVHDGVGLPVLADEQAIVLAFDDVAAALSRAVQLALDAHAQSWGYDSLLSAASYRDSSVARFSGEAEALTAWRDSVWMWAAALPAPEPIPKSGLAAALATVMEHMPAAPERP